MSQPTLIFGIGATKAGTSWLQAYLASHPECHFRAVKELHYFDTFERPQWRDRVPLQRLLDLVKKREGADAAGKAEIDLKISDFSDWQEMLAQPMAGHLAYISYLTSGNEAQKALGDFTPAYGMLSRELLGEMAALPLRTKFIYMLRDPLDRLWSNVRMAAFRLGAKGRNFAVVCADVLEKVLAKKHAHIEERSDYTGPIKNIDAALPQENVLFSFFEDLFSQAAIDKITAFLGLNSHMANFERVVHRGVKQEIDPDQRQRALEWLRPQYEFVLQRFGKQVPARWHTQLNGI